jgi:hypothetical protein
MHKGYSNGKAVSSGTDPELLVSLKKQQNFMYFPADFIGRKIVSRFIFWEVYIW